MYLDMYREQWRRDVGAYPKLGDPLLRTTVQIAVKRLNAKGVKARVTSLASGVGPQAQAPGRQEEALGADRPRVPQVLQHDDEAPQRWTTSTRRT